MQPTGGLTWMWSNNIALDLPLAAGFKHEITGDGAIAGVGKIGEIKALPATLLVQYRFGAPDAAVRPYIGAGPTFAKFYGGRSTLALTALTGGTPANPTTLSVQSKWTASGQVGLAWRLSTQWSIDTSVTYTPLKTRTTLSTGQTLDASLDPTSVSLGVGYRF
jgi:outer membrane protein